MAKSNPCRRRRRRRYWKFDCAAGDGCSLSCLREYCLEVSRAAEIPIPPNYPVMGEDAYRTGTGVHAAAVIKAIRKGDVELANLIYSGVPSHWFGLEQRIEIGPMSGRSNVEYWLEKHGQVASERLIAAIFEKAKSSEHILTDAEIRAIISDIL